MRMKEERLKLADNNKRRTGGRQNEKDKYGDWETSCSKKYRRADRKEVRL